MKLHRLSHSHWPHTPITSKFISHGLNFSLIFIRISYLIRFVLACRCENGDWAQRTDWHQIAVFNPIVRENVKNYLTKGQRVLLFGKITYGEIRDKDGNVRTTTSIVADDVTFFNH